MRFTFNFEFFSLNLSCTENQSEFLIDPYELQNKHVFYFSSCSKQKLVVASSEDCFPKTLTALVLSIPSQYEYFGEIILFFDIFSNEEKLRIVHRKENLCSSKSVR
eukprot:GHVP01046840.1.p1 GENE.GHVP01046840.1~~GHVP01046840.1.p1  ORF type:complete len:106 (-),score=16.87 GHVP01046840.1:174-491(-)